MKKDLHHILVHLHFLDAYAQIPHESIEESGDGSVTAIAKFIPILSNYLHLNQMVEFRLNANNLTLTTLPLKSEFSQFSVNVDVVHVIDDWGDPFELSLSYEQFQNKVSERLKRVPSQMRANTTLQGLEQLNFERSQVQQQCKMAVQPNGTLNLNPFLSEADVLSGPPHFKESLNTSSVEKLIKTHWEGVNLVSHGVFEVRLSSELVVEFYCEDRKLTCTLFRNRANQTELILLKSLFPSQHQTLTLEMMHFTQDVHRFTQIEPTLRYRT